MENSEDICTINLAYANLDDFSGPGNLLEQINNFNTIVFNLFDSALFIKNTY